SQADLQYRSSCETLNLRVLSFLTKLRGFYWKKVSFSMTYQIGYFINASYAQAASTNPAANRDNIWLPAASPNVPPPPIYPKRPIDINTPGTDQLTDFTSALLWANFIFTGGSGFFC